MKWYLIVGAVLVLVILGASYVFLRPALVVPDDTPPPTESVETYLREHIAALSPVPPVLGGTWYVTEVSVSTTSGTVAYEDGHIAHVADFTFHTDAGGVHIDSFVVRDAPRPSTQSGIRGTTLLGPTCPVERDPPDPECADKPYQTTLIVTTADQSRVIATIPTDASGYFVITLPPGTYAIRSAATANVLPYCASNGIVTVAAGTYTDTVVSCDTGIR